MSSSGSQREPLSGSVSGSLEERVARLEAENAVLRERVAHLVERIAALERRPGLNSRSSGKLSSSEGLAEAGSCASDAELEGEDGAQAGWAGGPQGGDAAACGAPGSYGGPDPGVLPGVRGVLVGCGSRRSGCAPAGRPSNAPPPGGGGASGSRAALRSLRDGGAVRVPGRRVGPGARGPSSCGGNGENHKAGAGPGRPGRAGSRAP